MKRAKFILTLSLTAGVLAFSGCQGAVSADVSADAETATELKSGYDLESTVTIDQTYWAGNNIRVRMSFDDKGNCKYGYVGKYELVTTEDGFPLLIFIFYADTEQDQMASSSFVLRDNGDGTYTKTVYIEGEEPDFEDQSVTVDLELDEGTDGLMNGDAFDGVYLSSDGQYYTFNADGTFAMETWMTYIADEDNIELIGAEDSTLYTYVATEDFSNLTLYKKDKKVMELATEEAIKAAEEAAASQAEVELPSLSSEGN